MSDPVTLSEALKAYSAKFKNIDQVMIPQLMDDQRLPGFLMKAVQDGKPVDRGSIETEFGPVEWEW